MAASAGAMPEKKAHSETNANTLSNINVNIALYTLVSNFWLGYARWRLHIQWPEAVVRRCSSK